MKLASKTYSSQSSEINSANELYNDFIKYNLIWAKRMLKQVCATRTYIYELDGRHECPDMTYDLSMVLEFAHKTILWMNYTEMFRLERYLEISKEQLWVFTNDSNSDDNIINICASRKNRDEFDKQHERYEKFTDCC